MSYLPVGDKAFKKAWTMLPEITRQGKIAHIIFGARAGIEVTGFQYSTVLHTGQVPITIYRTIFSSQTRFVPAIFITSRNAMERLLLRAGFRKGVLTGDASFDNNWRMTCGDEVFARTLLDDQLRGHILSKRTVNWRLHSGRLCLIYPGIMRGDRVSAAIDRLGLV